MLRSRWPTALFLTGMVLLAVRPYRYSLYDIDMLGYIGNAVAMSGADIKEIHRTVYKEIDLKVPELSRRHLLGQDNTGPSSQLDSRQDRAANPYHFAEFLPCFAIRPVFNELIYLMHRCGIGLVRATILIAVLSYVGFGLVLFAWLSAYISQIWAALFSFVLLITPPILNLARFNTPDSLSCLLTVAALYLMLERQSLFWGILLLLISVYVRTDNVLIAVAAFGYCSLNSRQLDKAKAAVLIVVAVSSVLLINHFAGDYGWKVLYYRSFIAIPNAPGELVAQFGIRDYMRALRSGISQIADSSFIPFTFIGLAGVANHPSRAIWGFVAITSVYASTHFLLFPSGQERFWGPFYLAMGLAITSTLSRVRRHEETPSGRHPEMETSSCQKRVEYRNSYAPSVNEAHRCSSLDPSIPAPKYSKPLSRDETPIPWCALRPECWQSRYRAIVSNSIGWCRSSASARGGLADSTARGRLGPHHHHREEMLA